MRKEGNSGVEEQASKGYMWLNGTTDDPKNGILVWARGQAIFDEDSISIIPRGYYRPIEVQKALLADIPKLAAVILLEDEDIPARKEALTEFIGKYGLLLYGRHDDRINRASWKMTWEQWESHLSHLISLLLTFASIKACVDSNLEDSDVLFWCREKMKLFLHRSGEEVPSNISDDQVITHSSMQLAELLSVHLINCPVQVVSYSYLKRLGFRESSDHTKFGFDIRVDNILELIYRYLATVVVSSDPIGICVICAEIFPYRKGKKTCGAKCRKALSRFNTDGPGADEDK